MTWMKSKRTNRRFELSKRHRVRNDFTKRYFSLLNTYVREFRKSQYKLSRIEFLTNYGEVRLEAGDSISAHAALLQALELAPEHAQCHNNLGVFYWQMGERQKSVWHFTKAREINPNHRDTVWNCGQIMADAGEYMMVRYTYNEYMKENGFDEEMAEAIERMKTG